jgi:hypothetical protein
MRSSAVPEKVDGCDPNVASALLREIGDATGALNACLSELEEVLAQPAFDPSALTSVRLRLAGIRLTRGPLITRLSDFLSAKVTTAQQAALDELRVSHQRILQAATLHTAKWTLNAISEDWLTYRRETRALVSRWRAKANQDAKLIYPLIEKAVDR